MSENNDVPPHVKLRNKISKEIEVLTSTRENQILGVAIKEDTLMVFFMPNGTDIVRVHERHVRASRASNKISKPQALRMVTFLYNQVVSDKGMMEINDGKIAVSQAVLASNPYGITANDITMRGMSAQELCGREAKTIGNLSDAMAHIANALDIELTAQLVTATLEHNCPKTQRPQIAAPITTNPSTTRPTVIWPAASTSGGTAISQYRS
ncbi:MAG: hypothetical protein K2Q32_03920 [Alphaproteobacteria bacterium]|nr:hypothetical protein [Alphaproteobacteria bacterium]